jgi:hypothetical protein
LQVGTRITEKADKGSDPCTKAEEENEEPGNYQFEQKQNQPNYEP